MKINEIITENVRMPVHKSFAFDGIKYDNNSGLGVVPFNSNVLYVGFAAVFSADDFLSLAHKADRMESAKKFADMIIDEDVAIASPFLSIDVTETGSGGLIDPQVTGHEGRGRALAIKLLAEGYRKEDQKSEVGGDVVVHFFMQGGLRSRHLTPEFFTGIKHSGIISEEGERVRVKIKEIFNDPTWR